MELEKPRGGSAYRKVLEFETNIGMTTQANGDSTLLSCAAAGLVVKRKTGRIVITGRDYSGSSEKCTDKFVFDDGSCETPSAQSSEHGSWNDTLCYQEARNTLTTAHLNNVCAFDSLSIRWIDNTTASVLIAE